MSFADRDGFIWYDGKLVPWREATTHVLTYTLHYGVGCFEGVRAYETPKGTAVFRLAEHTHNLERDGRASVFVTEAFPMGDPMDNGRLTLLGTARRIEGGASGARAAFLERHPEGRAYVDFGDFSFWALQVEAVRWVGGFGRMAWCTPEEYRAAEADPTPPLAPAAVAHLNADHADSMLDAARAFTGHPDALAARVVRLDRYGVELDVSTPRGPAIGRVPFDPPVDSAEGLRAAAVHLAHAARAALG